MTKSKGSIPGQIGMNWNIKYDRMVVIVMIE